MKKYQKEQLLALLKKGSIRLVTDHGDIDQSHLSMVGENGEAIYETPFASVKVSVYEKGGDTVYRSVKLLCRSDLTLYRIDFVTRFGQEPVEFIEYRSFLNASAAAFVRYDSIGFYTGVENPLSNASLKIQDIRIPLTVLLTLQGTHLFILYISHMKISSLLPMPYSIRN